MLKYFQLYDDAAFRERQCELGKQSARADRECSVNRDLGGEAHKVSYFWIWCDSVENDFASRDSFHNDVMNF